MLECSFFFLAKIRDKIERSWYLNIGFFSDEFFFKKFNDFFGFGLFCGDFDDFLTFLKNDFLALQVIKNLWSSRKSRFLAKVSA